MINVCSEHHYTYHLFYMKIHHYEFYAMVYMDI